MCCAERAHPSLEPAKLNSNLCDYAQALIDCVSAKKIFTCMTFDFVMLLLSASHIRNQ